MKKTRTTVTLCGVALATCLTVSPAFAAKTALDDGALGKVSGKADNAFTFGNTSVSDTTITNTNTKDVISFGWFQWNDHHGTDTSDHKGANDQSGVTSSVQQAAVAQVNGLTWGWSSQNLLTNGDTTTLTGTELNMAYGATVVGGF